MFKGMVKRSIDGGAIAFFELMGKKGYRYYTTYPKFKPRLHLLAATDHFETSLQ